MIEALATMKNNMLVMGVCTLTKHNQHWSYCPYARMTYDTDIAQCVANTHAYFLLGVTS